MASGVNEVRVARMRSVLAAVCQSLGLNLTAMAELARSAVLVERGSEKLSEAPFLCVGRFQCRVVAGSVVVSGFGQCVCAVSYTHLTLPTRSTV